MVTLAITGGIACGKSLTAQFLSARGIPVCDTDQVGHALLKRGEPVGEAVAREFGPSILGSDGEINRSELGKQVFAAPGRLARLNELTHPAIMQHTRDWMAAQGGSTGIAAAVIPLLYEIGDESQWTSVLCVAAPEEDQLKRLAERGLTPDEARARIASQLGLAVKMERADYVVYNCGSKTLLEEQVEHVVRSLRGE